MAIDPQPPEELPSSLSEAKRLGYRKYFTGKPCKYGHLAPRYTSTHGCEVCVTERYKKWRRDNPDKMRSCSNRWKQNNGQHLSRFEKNRYWRDPEHFRRKSSAWCRDNPGLNRAQASRRRSAKIRQTPAWFDEDEVKKVYAEARRLEKETGLKYHVDHIYPLKGKTVSGLHVAENLEPVPAHINLTKHNSHPDEYYEDQDDR